MSLSEEGLTLGLAGLGTDGGMEMSSSSNGGDHGSGNIPGTLAGGATMLLDRVILLAEVATLSSCLSALARAVAHLWRHFKTSGDLEEVTGGVNPAEYSGTVVTLGVVNVAICIAEPLS